MAPVQSSFVSIPCWRHAALLCVILLITPLSTFAETAPAPPTVPPPTAHPSPTHTPHPVHAPAPSKHAPAPFKHLPAPSKHLPAPSKHLPAQTPATHPASAPLRGPPPAVQPTVASPPPATPPTAPPPQLTGNQGVNSLPPPVGFPGTVFPTENMFPPPDGEFSPEPQYNAYAPAAGGLSGGAIAGIVIGVLLATLLLVAGIWVILARSRNTSRQQYANSYGDGTNM